MTIINVRLNQAEDRIFTEYAKFHGKSLSNLLKESLTEKMEEELDAKLLAEARKYNEKSPETYTHDQVKKELGLSCSK